MEYDSHIESATTTAATSLTATTTPIGLLNNSEGVVSEGGDKDNKGDNKENKDDRPYRESVVDVQMLDEYPVMTSDSPYLLHTRSPSFSGSATESNKMGTKGGLFTRNNNDKKFNLGFKMGFGTKKGPTLGDGSGQVTDSGINTTPRGSGSSSSCGSDRYHFEPYTRID